MVAMPDEVYGEKACAFVILKDGCKLGFEELSAFMLSRGIAKFKLPERLEIVTEFPLSAAGKILRRDLREMIAAKIAAYTYAFLVNRHLDRPQGRIKELWA